MSDETSPTADRAALPDLLSATYAREASPVWGVLYRMTGSASDADDLLQETFTRALERPPLDTNAPLGPWLTRVAVNLGRDHLRKRKRRVAAAGTWLPSPIRTEESLGAYEPILPSGDTAEHRYDLLESVSFAFLLALEALSPAQRAVLLLRDVFDYSARETGEALDLSEPNVRQLHARARKKMEGYRARRTRAESNRPDAMGLVESFLAHVAAGDVAAIESLLADDVRALSDGGGELKAAVRPVEGRAKVARLLAKLAEKNPVAALSTCMLNGVPSLVIELEGEAPRRARRFTLSLELDADGAIRSIYLVLSPKKLTHV